MVKALKVSKGGKKEKRSHFLKNRGKAPEKQLKLPGYKDETSIGYREENASVNQIKKGQLNLSNWPGT